MNETKSARCRKYLDWALSPVGGEEPPAFLLSHLDRCESCTEERRRLETDDRALDALIGRSAAGEPPAEFAPVVLESLPTPAWRLRDPKIWLLPAATLGGLAAASVALLHPLPAGFVDQAAPLALFRAPLEIVGETARVLARGAAVVSEGSGSLFGLPPAAGPITLLLAGLGVLAAVRRFAPGRAPHFGASVVRRGR